MAANDSASETMLFAAMVASAQYFEQCGNPFITMISPDGCACKKLEQCAEIPEDHRQDLVEKICESDCLWFGNIHSGKMHIFTVTIDKCQAALKAASADNSGEDDTET